MGIIIVNLIMVIYIIFSVMSISKRNLVGCQLVGLIGVFATFSCAAYHFYLSELILSVSKVFNPKDLSHLKYHFYAIMIGLVFAMLSIIIEDIGITVSIYFICFINFIVFWNMRCSKRFNIRISICNNNCICMALLHILCNQVWYQVKQ